jgi:hypothetical protein
MQQRVKINKGKISGMFLYISRPLCVGAGVGRTYSRQFALRAQLSLHHHQTKKQKDN